MSTPEHLRDLQFTAHNIRLDDGSVTRSTAEPSIDQTPVFLAARNAIELVYPGSKKGLSVVDLGCLEGGYNVEVARMGLDALGLEVRQSNMACCHHVQSRVNLPNLRFVLDDADNIEAHGPFDITFCCGLLYHLEYPRDYLMRLGEQTKKVLILSTHFALQDGLPSRYPLSPTVVHEGLYGRWFVEYDRDDVPLAERENARWSSYKNRRSFWIRRDQLVEVLYEAGFDTVLEQFDMFRPDLTKGLMLEYSDFLRGMFIAVKR